MRLFLKVLGLTIWGLVAIGLLAIFIFVGYEVALKFRGAAFFTADIPAGSGQPNGDTAETGPVHNTVKQTAPASTVSPSELEPSTPDLTRLLLRGAVEQHQYEAAQQYGQQLVDGGNAEPDDFVFIVQAYYSAKDCENALIWVERASAVFGAAKKEPDKYLNLVRTRCASDGHSRGLLFDSTQQERAARLLKALSSRAEADLKDLPALEAEAANSKSGDLDIKIGQLYYGHEDFQHAIAALRRGLDKGQVTHLDEAYVYLGLSEQAVHDVAQARVAFGKLKEVPNISPRVLRLWELYADTQL